MMSGFVHDSFYASHITCCLCVHNIDLTAEEGDEREGREIAIVQPIKKRRGSAELVMPNGVMGETGACRASNFYLSSST